jgi:TonB-dependent SusC/RagA subfamily outer membrane receptor
MTPQLLILVALLLAGCASSAPVQRGADERFDHQAATMEDLLETEILSRFPGVRMTRDIDGIHLRIRGSLQDPLYVVDGMPLTDGALWGINPYEIEAIEIVKDAARLAMYGMRGAGGVVFITTKRPNSRPN